GDHCGLLWRPHSLMNGTPAVSIGDAVPRVVRARYSCPSRANTTYLPSGESSGEPPPRPPPAATSVFEITARRQAPLPSVFAAHTARSGPSGLCDGLATQPTRF